MDMLFAEPIQFGELFYRCLSSPQAYCPENNKVTPVAFELRQIDQGYCSLFRANMIEETDAILRGTKIKTWFYENDIYYGIGVLNPWKSSGLIDNVEIQPKPNKFSTSHAGMYYYFDDNNNIRQQFKISPSSDDPSLPSYLKIITQLALSVINVIPYKP